MGRWDKDGGYSRKTNSPKLFKRIIFIGFAIVATVILTVFILTYGLKIDILQRGGDIQTISIKISNNNFFSLNDVTVQFDNGKVQSLGNLGPFASVYVTPDKYNINFKSIMLKANNGQIELVKRR